jgi:hypothetical protein
MGLSFLNMMGEYLLLKAIGLTSIKLIFTSKLSLWFTAKKKLGYGSPHQASMR